MVSFFVMVVVGDMTQVVWVLFRTLATLFLFFFEAIAGNFVSVGSGDGGVGVFSSLLLLLIPLFFLFLFGLF